MDEQAATCPCRCHCYALKKNACVCSREHFFLSSNSSKILGFMIICCIYSSSQTIYSHLCSYLQYVICCKIHLNQINEFSQSKCVRPSEHKKESCNTSTNICSFLSFLISKPRLANAVNLVFTCFFHIFFPADEEPTSHQFVPPLLSKDAYCRLMQTN